LSIRSEINRESPVISLHISSAQLRAVKLLLRSKRFSYCNEEELIVHAIQRHLDWLELVQDVGEIVSALQRELTTEAPVTADLVAGRVKVNELEKDLSDLLHLFHGLLTFIATRAQAGLKPALADALHFKLLQFPQGFRVGRKLIDLDEQFGSVLENGGIWLKRWVYEPREKA